MSNHPDKSEVDITSTEDALFSRVALFANPRKTDYLGYRACNFSIREACNLVPITQAQVLKWRREDPEFAKYELNINELQRDLGPTILRMDFIRNVKLFLKIDFGILFRASLSGINVTDCSLGEALRAGLTQREFDYLKTIRKEYGPAAMLALHKALEPVTEDDRGMLGHDRVVVVVDGEIIEGEAARSAAGAALLNQFKRNKEMLPEGKRDDDGGSNSG